MRSRSILLVAGILTVAAPASAQGPAEPSEPFSVVEKSIPELRQAMERGVTTSREIVLQYLARIATYEDRLNAVMYVNPAALAILEQAEAAR